MKENDIVKASKAVFETCQIRKQSGCGRCYEAKIPRGGR